MITVQEAIELVKNNTKPLLKNTVKPIGKSGGYILYNDVYSPINMPPFRQSAMDGYAINSNEGNTYNVINEIQAGDAHQPILKQGEAIRIFTGAAVPDSANAVIMQEKVRAEKNKIIVKGDITKNSNIRPLGEQVKQGDIALAKGTKLTPAAIGYLTSLGITEVTVYKKPNIALITTGNELVKAGNPLPFGKIYESNATMLQSALYNLKYYDITLHSIEDDYKKTKQKLESTISQNDLVIITGGISVGDYDFVGKALKELQVTECFYKVKQKPGKPLFFGKKDNTTIFALPGNPAAALSCFYIYVYIALQNIVNRSTLELSRVSATSTTEFHKKGDRPQFLKAIYNNGEVTLLEGQSSAMLQTFAHANALVFVPEAITTINLNDTVEVILLPT